MSIWSTPTIRGIECGAICRECELPITDSPEGEPTTCDDCRALDAGIPLSVIKGETKLTDHFSREYIDHQAGAMNYKMRRN
jgi:hypothetical protein